MAFVIRKVADHGTQDPLVARISYQWTQILPWFNLSPSRKERALEILLMKVQPGFFAVRDTAGSLQDRLNAIIAGKEAISGVEELAGQLCRQANHALNEYAHIFGVLLGRNAPTRNYAALTKWAVQWFGAEDSLSVLLEIANRNWIRFLTDLYSAASKCEPVQVIVGSSLNSSTWGSGSDGAASLQRFLGWLTRGVIPFVEETLMAALHHLTVRSPIRFEDIPEAERDAAAPIRYRALALNGEGKWVPAGKISLEGNAVPELQRLLQQGQGKPIIATKVGDEWFVASGSRLYHSNKWKNFHDFLFDYIKSLLGGTWTGLEFNKPREERHPLMVWFEDVKRFLGQYAVKGQPAPMTALGAAYLGLAYDLYLISHNNGKVHEDLIRRLKQVDQFYGAYYEASVAGKMLHAGFDIELEDESDISTSHCEFTATHRASGQKLSVEAKMRQVKAGAGEPKPPEIRWLLGKALKKRAAHPRIVFIEVNDAATPIESQQKLLLDLLASVRGKEANFPVNGQPAPPAYLVVTNNPPDSIDRPHSPAYLFEGFKMHDFRTEGGYMNLRAALEARKKHAAMWALVESYRLPRLIPVTFDGERRAFANLINSKRLLIGSRYRISTPTGEVAGELTHGVVMPDQSFAVCVLRQDGRDHMVNVPLDANEMEAYRESPRTFFGREEPEARIDDPLKLYDWFYESYKGNSKEALLVLFTKMGAADLSALSAMPHERLAEIFAERTTEVVAMQTGLVKPIIPPL